MATLSAVTITPVNPSTCTAGEVIHFVVNAITGGTAPFTYQWQQWNGTAYANITSQTNSAYNYSTAIGTARIRVEVTDSNSTPDVVDSAATYVIAASVYDTFGVGLTTIDSDLGDILDALNDAVADLDIIKKAVQ